VSQFKVGKWVWVFYLKIVPGSCDRLRSYWAGLYQIIRKISPALEEVMTVYRLVRIDLFKEFRGDNGVHGFITSILHYCKQMS